MRKKLYMLLGVLILALSMAGCGEPEAVLFESTLEADGGTALVEDGPLKGLSVEVAEGASDGAINIRISQGETPAEMPENAKSISPVVEISSSEPFLFETAFVNIPHETKDGEISVAFFKNGRETPWEGVPATAVDSESITLATNRLEDMVVVNAEKASIDKLPVVDTGFRPGADDFQFANRGSYVNPDGHCAGQSVAMLWHYKNRRLKGEEPLYGLWDNNGKTPTPNLWQDDSWAYRLSSSVHTDAGGNNRKSFFADYAWQASEIASGMLFAEEAELQFYSMKYAMAASKRPQGIAIYSSDPGVEGGHFIFAYKIDGNTVYLCDPNEPGDVSRTITFDGKQFTPYVMNGKDYDEIYWCGEFALVDEYKVGERWAEVESGALFNNIFEHPQIIIGGGLSADPNRLNFRVELSPAVASKLYLSLYKPEAKIWYEDFDHPVYSGGSYRQYDIPGFVGNEKKIGFLFQSKDKDWYDFQWVEFTGGSDLVLVPDKDLYQPGERVTVRLETRSGDPAPFALFYVDGDRSGTVGQGTVGAFNAGDRYTREMLVECYDPEGVKLAELVLKVDGEDRKDPGELTRMESETKIWYEDGEGRRQGEVTGYFDPEKTRIHYVISYVDDMKDGWEIVYNEDGTLERETEYRRDLKHGEHREYDSSGYLDRMTPYVDNMEQGMAYSYYPDGTVASEMPYENGKEHGTWRKYYPGGALKSEATYENGTRVSPLVNYYEDGTVKKVLE